MSFVHCSHTDEAKIKLLFIFRFLSLLSRERSNWLWAGLLLLTKWIALISSVKVSRLFEIMDFHVGCKTTKSFQQKTERSD